jgi:uncharacterized protein (TIGR03083 family)
VEYADHVEAAVRELAALDAALAGGSLGAPVPTCPGWTLSDLAQHVGEFCGFWTHVLCDGNGRPKTPFAHPPEGDGRRAWLGRVGQGLVRELSTTSPETKVWTWYELDQTAAFVARRVANELAVHRYDAQSATRTCQPIDRTLAVDGIDELVDRLVGQRPRSGDATGQTIHLHGTDKDGATGATGAEADNHPPAEWLLALHPDRIEVTRAHAKGDLALRGAVSDLELVLFGRPALSPVERLGDESVLDTWYREFRF